MRSVKREARAVLGIEASFARELKTGDSVSVSGVCLTVTETKGSVFKADVSPRTLKITTLGSLKRGDVVNLERALAVGDRLGGHIVTGHVDGVGKILRVRREKGTLVLAVEAPVKVADYLIERGSIAVDGVSLTAFNVVGSIFEVSVIPHTAEVTTLGSARPGDFVNIEADIMAKQAKGLLRRDARLRSGADRGLTFDKLKELGYS